MILRPVYLDYNATTPVDPRVLDRMLPFFGKDFGNAASLQHSFGWAADSAVKTARGQLAELLGSGPQEIVFTSGATESVNLALKGVAEMYAGKGNHLITATTEHAAVLDTCAHLERSGFSVTRLEVNGEGAIDLEALARAIRPETILVSLMYANNETGVLHPVREISRITRQQNVLFFSDATQAVGKIPVDVGADGIDLLACSAHKIYGPKGIGALYVRRRDPRVRLMAQMDGGGHERGLRSGTLNVPGIAGFGAAAALCQAEMAAEGAFTRKLRDGLEAGLLSLPGSFRNGDPGRRLPQVTNLGFSGVDGEQLMMELRQDVALATGSACTSASPEPSHVLLAMGLGEARAKSSLRMGFGRFSTAADQAFAGEKLALAVNRLREAAGALTGGN